MVEGVRSPWRQQRLQPPPLPVGQIETPDQL
jgi:hypothetical protein